MVVVVPAFIVLFAGMLFLHHTVAMTQESMLAARNGAWEKAMKGCQGDEGVPQPDRTSDMQDAAGAEVSTTASLGYETGTAENTVEVSILAAGAAPMAEARGLHFESDVHSKVVVMCNTQAAAGDFPGVLEWFLNSDSNALVGAIRNAMK